MYIFSIISYFDPFGDLKSTRKELSRRNYKSEKTSDEISSIIEVYNNGKYYNAVRIAKYDNRRKEIFDFDKSSFLTSKAPTAQYQHVPGY